MITRIREKKEAGFSLLELSVAVGVSAIVASAGIVATTTFIGSAQDKRDNYTANADSAIEAAESSSLALGTSGLSENEPEETEEPFYLASNGVTVVCDTADFGDEGVINNVTYTKRAAADITTSNASTTCTSGITNMQRLFYYASDFNEDINSWDTSNVTDMVQMFYDAYTFNQDINSWDTSSVTDMSEMFMYASDFDGNISSWDTSSVTTMSGMFNWTMSFNQDLSGWCVTDITAEPSNFDVNTTDWVKTDRQPVWGTCPQ